METKKRKKNSRFCTTASNIRDNFTDVKVTNTAVTGEMSRIYGPMNSVFDILLPLDSVRSEKVEKRTSKTNDVSSRHSVEFDELDSCVLESNICLKKDFEANCNCESDCSIVLEENKNLECDGLARKSIAGVVFNEKDENDGPDFMVLYSKTADTDTIVPSEGDNISAVDNSDEQNIVFKLSDISELIDQDRLNRENDLLIEGSRNIIPTDEKEIFFELQDADEKAHKMAGLIEIIKGKIKIYQEKDNISDEDQLALQDYKLQLSLKLKEFEAITARVRELVGLANISTIENHSLNFDDTVISDVKKESVGIEVKEIAPSIDTIHEESNEDLHEDNLKIDPNAIDIKSEPLIEVHPKEDQEVPSSFLTEHSFLDSNMPKVIICSSEDNVSRIIVCDSVKKGSSLNSLQSCKHVSTTTEPTNMSSGTRDTSEVPELMISLTGRLCESYSIQEKLATENAELEGGRYHLQEELLQKDNTVDSLQKKVGSLQTELRIISKENNSLSAKIAQMTAQNACKCCSCPGQGQQSSTPPEISPEDVAQIQQYTDTTLQLESQLNQIENEVRSMQQELLQVQQERKQLEEQRQILLQSAPPSNLPCPPCPARLRDSNGDQQIRELKELHARLEDDYKDKVTEVATLRRENEKLKETMEMCSCAQTAAESQAKLLQDRIQKLEAESRKALGSKELLVEQEQQLSLARQRFRECQDEVEELRSLVQDLTAQMEDYRNKYLAAQQTVEEQRRQIDVIEADNSRISDQVNMEIQRVKNQFQEKLQELAPLPDILKATQIKLQECQQMRLLAERNCEDLMQELQELKDANNDLIRNMETQQKKGVLGSDERSQMQNKLEEKDELINQLRKELVDLRTQIARLEEMNEQCEKRFEEKLHEIAQLSNQLTLLREESARQVARMKERCETIKRSMQNQISDLERQLAQSRAIARAAQKERDDIRQSMQCQINNLNESFDQAQMRIRSLQTHVNYLKTSYSNVFIQDSNPVCECNANPLMLMPFGADQTEYNFS